MYTKLILSLWKLIENNIETLKLDKDGFEIFDYEEKEYEDDGENAIFDSVTLTRFSSIKMDLLKLFSRTKTSKDVAKERLKLVLVHDRANVSPQFLEMVKGEIIKVISHYMDIEENSLDIQMTRTKSEDGERFVPALIANIPIKNMKS